MRALLCIATFLILSPFNSFAGPVESDVLVCGSTMPYQRYVSEQAPAILGDGSDGLRDSFFRIKSYLSVEKNSNNPSQSRFAAVADFIAATQLRGLKICVRGDVETKARPAGTPSDPRGGTDTKFLYFVSPKSFQITEPAFEVLSPSELPGTYEGSSTINGHPAALNLRVNLTAFDQEEVGQKYLFPELPFILTDSIGKNCEPIDPLFGNPAALSIEISRAEKQVLTGVSSVRCAQDNPDDIVTLTLRLERNLKGVISGTVHVDRPAKAYGFIMQIHSVAKAN